MKAKAQYETNPELITLVGLSTMHTFKWLLYPLWLPHLEEWTKRAVMNNGQTVSRGVVPSASSSDGPGGMGGGPPARGCAARSLARSSPRGRRHPGRAPWLL